MSDPATGSDTAGDDDTGNGWVICRCGHRHWGLYGAAGLLVTDGTHVLLAHRAGWTHQGGTWAVPGGARERHETATQTARREACEETTLALDRVSDVSEWIDDHGDWSYTTVLARIDRREDVTAAEQSGLVRGVLRRWQENDEVRWWPLADVESLQLHPGFAAAWPQLRAMITALITDRRPR